MVHPYAHVLKPPVVIDDEPGQLSAMIDHFLPLPLGEPADEEETRVYTQMQALRQAVRQDYMNMKTHMGPYASLMRDYPLPGPVVRPCQPTCQPQYNCTPPLLI